jgi:uncharacterized protein YecE (DUF72 family)
VEVNSTFYRPCNPRSAQSWAERTPDNFEFTVKVWQQFTHSKDKVELSDLDVFKQGIAPLAASGKAGCLLFQFPASFHCTDAARDRLRLLLDAFPDYEKAVELRHRSWDEHRDFLDEMKAIATFIDEPKFRDSTRQTLRPHRGILYLRLHGRSADKWWRHEHRNERYDYLYSKEEIRPYAVRLKAIADENAIEKAYVFFNNHPGAKAVANAVMMRTELDIPVTQELPETLLARFPGIAR